MSSMHRIFATQEMVEEILSYIPSRQLAGTTTRVNHNWFLYSVKFIWRSMSIKEALEPLGVNDWQNKFKGFRKHPSPAQWDRFTLYSPYVRELLGRESDVSLLRTAMRSLPKTVSHLFPNLRSLEWRVVRHKALPNFSGLNSPRLESINIRLRSLPLPVFRALCDTLATRVENLRCLQIRLYEPSQDMYTAEYNESFNQVLRALAPKLTNVQIPEAFHTEETVQELRRLRNLSELEIGESKRSWTDKHSTRNWDRVYGKYDEGEEYFGRLKNLLFTGSQRAFCNMFLNKETFSSLVRIRWNRCMALDDPLSFVTIVSILCPMLKSLTLGDGDMYFKEDDILPPIIPWAIVRILLKCQYLTDLALHCCRVSMTSEDLVELLTSRRNGMPTMWEGLAVYTETPLIISDLILFAKYCPRLERLGMHFDMTSIDDTPSPSTAVQDDAQSPLKHRGPEFTFTKLSLVNFAYSPLDHNLLPKFASFFIEMCEFIPDIDGWEWLEFWSYIYESVEARGKFRDEEI